MFTTDKQDEVVSKAIDALEIEIGTVLWPHVQVRQYMEYVYSIGFLHGTRFKKHEKRIIQLKDGLIVNVFSSASDAARKMNCALSVISKAANNKTIDFNGFEWVYF